MCCSSVVWKPLPIAVLIQSQATVQGGIYCQMIEVQYGGTRITHQLLRNFGDKSIVSFTLIMPLKVNVLPLPQSYVWANWNSTPLPTYKNFTRGLMEVTKRMDHLVYSIAQHVNYSEDEGIDRTFLLLSLFIKQLLFVLFCKHIGIFSVLINVWTLLYTHFLSYQFTIQYLLIWFCIFYQ